MSSTCLSKKTGSQSGFTLLEVLIAICVLAFISVGILQAVQQTYGLRIALSTEGDFYNSIRLSMNILQRDITSLYSPIAFIPGPSPSPSASFIGVQPRPAAGAAAPDPTLAQTFEFWGPAIDSSGIRPSHFIGTENKLTFVANSHLRVYKDSQESEFASIAYDLATDDADKSAQMLVKTESTDAFSLDVDRKDPSLRVYALLHGIKKFKYRYYRKDKDAWGPSWDSDSDEQKNIYPDIVELTVQVEQSKLSFDGTFLFRPEMPLRAINPSM
jgi:general secretion pathway protein J